VVSWSVGSDKVSWCLEREREKDVRQYSSFSRQSVSSSLVRQSSVLYSVSLTVLLFSSQLSVRETLILIQRCTFRSAVVIPFCHRLLPFSSSSLVNRRLQSVVRPSTVIFSPSSDRSTSPLDYDIARGSRVNFDRASSSSVVSQAVLRAVVCWSEEDNFIPFITGFGFSLKFPI